MCSFLNFKIFLLHYQLLVIYDLRSAKCWLARIIFAEQTTAGNAVMKPEKKVQH